MRFENKVAVITGGAHGIGKAIADAGIITGEIVCMDGDMTKLMIYHGEHKWSYEK